ncbi:MAG: YdeI/OmpD-associated family protein [Rhodobacteraceae bacterium]|nr:YdeI/OmpD-associated family protein [Paracoccaceae bacterium]
MADVIFFENQDAFGDWLEGHTDASELWVGYLRKSTGRASLTWSASVDAALCFGWIDGIRKTIDDQSYKIRFTPRKIRSVWSAVNVKKVEALIPLGKMKPAGMHVFNNRSDVKGYSSEDRNVPLSGAFEAQIRANQPAWLFLTNLAPSYKRDSIWWVMSAKREETRLRRLGILIESSEAGLKIPSLRKKS